MKPKTGFDGELRRFAGDGAKQKAIAFAAKFPGSWVITGEGYKAHGVSPCYVILERGAKVPADAHIVHHA